MPETSGPVLGSVPLRDFGTYEVEVCSVGKMAKIRGLTLTPVPASLWRITGEHQVTPGANFEF